MSKYEVLTGENVLPQKRLARKGCYNEKMWVLKAQTDITKKHKSNYSFYKHYHDIKKFYNLSLESKYLLLAEFFRDLSEFNKLKTHKRNRKEKKNAYNTASKLSNSLLER